ncbi:MAG: hypothetical protein Hals2KO_01530 [Halioglobus sp.]
MRIAARTLCCLLLVLASDYLAAQERILSFHSDIAIARDGSMVVEETIRVVSEGKQIRRGIYREFPTRYRDRYGNVYRVDFEVLALSRDGNEEPWHTRNLSNGVRIYAGHSDVLLEPGEYSYRILYRTDWQIGFFEKRDELYWNVTGNGWAFAIDHASARVTLPQPVAVQDLSIEGYTGEFGSKRRDVATAVKAGETHIEATVPLGPREGLTLAMSWPKGVVEAPGYVRRMMHLLAANLSVALASLAFFGSAVYLFLMWRRYGRDPQEGVIFPHYEPPAGYSPASLRYVNRMGYDDQAFSAAIINLAVKGYLDIHCDDGDYTLHRKAIGADAGPGDLSSAERRLLEKLFSAGSRLVLDKVNHAVVAAARRVHRAALKREYRGLYFKTNGMLMAPSFIASLILFGITLLAGTFAPLALALFAAVIALHVLFTWLLKAPSQRGRRLMDKSAGFRLYLKVAEKDDLNLRNPPKKTPQLFEAYLPFAIALDVEQAWAEQFSEVLAGIRDPQTGQPYHPAWYSGNFNASRIGSFSTAVGSGFSSAVSSASTAPGSSSGGGGGGFSGGGGGGGGGGGW